MKTPTTIITTLLIASTPALAASGAEAEGNGLLLMLFLGFGALIITCQLLPGLLLFGAMLKGLFSTPTRATDRAR